MSDTPDMDRLREVAAEMSALELLRVLGRAVMNQKGWRDEADALLGKIRRGEFDVPAHASFAASQKRRAI